MTTLIELEAEFIRYNNRDGRISHSIVDTLEQAQGVQFLCPKCFETNGGARRTHMVLCWSRERGTPVEATPGPGRWKLVGTCMTDLTLDGEDGKTRSVHLTGPGCGFHGFITNGEASLG